MMSAEKSDLGEVALIDDLTVSPIGVMKGDTAPLSGLAAVPVELVNLGVANAGEATTTNADTSTSASSTAPLRDFMVT